MTPAKTAGINISKNLFDKLVADRINEKCDFLQWSFNNHCAFLVTIWYFKSIILKTSQNSERLPSVCV